MFTQLEVRSCVRARPRAENKKEENAMNRIAAYLTWAALGAVLVASGPAWAQAYRYSPYGYAYDYG